MSSVECENTAGALVETQHTLGLSSHALRHRPGSICSAVQDFSLRSLHVEGFPVTSSLCVALAPHSD